MIDPIRALDRRTGRDAYIEVCSARQPNGEVAWYADITDRLGYYTDVLDRSDSPDDALIEAFRKLGAYVCPRCGGTGMVLGSTGPYGDDPNRSDLTQDGHGVPGGEEYIRREGKHNTQEYE